MSQLGRGTVPKFGSFKPKAAPKSTGDGQGENGEKSGDRTRRQSRSDSRKRHERRRSRSPRQIHRREHEERKRHHSRDHEGQPRKRTPSPKVAKDEPEESDFFIIDRRGDKKNVEYGSLHRYSIPAHYRFGNGRVLGTPRDIRIDRDASTEKHIVLQSTRGYTRDREPRPLASKRRSKTARGVRLIIPASEVKDVNADDDFIELRTSLKRKRDSESPEPAFVAGVDYRSIEGKAKASTAPNDEDVEYTTGSESGDAESVAQQVVRERNSVFSKQAKDSPTDAEAWLALIEHQASVVVPGEDVSSLSSSQRRTLADVRLSIYDRALKNVAKGSTGHDSLVLGCLKEGSVIWENSKLATKWSEALKENSTSITLWTNYLDFVQTDHANFSYGNCKDVYVRFLRMLRHARSHESADKQAELASAQIRILLRFTSFERDAGYDELAYAIWQVILEFHSFKPPELLNTGDVLDALEAFWESDVPRIGEDDATGWASFQAGASHGGRSSQTLSTKSHNIEKTVCNVIARELKLTESLFLPAAADDEHSSDDPFRFVMFADMKDIVENMLATLPKLELVSAFLCFVGLPPLQTNGNSIGRGSRSADPLLCLPNSNDITRSGRTRHTLNKPTTAVSLLAVLTDKRSADSDIASGWKMFVRRALQQLISTMPNDDKVAEYYLVFTLVYFPDEAIKTAKRLLKSRPSSLRLYNAYALIEASLGHLIKAEEVWSTALAISSAWPEEKQVDAILLQHSRLMILVGCGQDYKALRYLVSPGVKLQDDVQADKVDVGAAERLKAVRTFEEGFDVMRATTLSEHGALYVDCLAWLSYLLEDHGLASALAVYARYAAKLTSSTDDHTLELVHQARAEFLRLHIRPRRPFKPALIRDLLNQSIRLFPENCLFYETISLISSQTRIDDRLSDALQSSTQRPAESGLVVWFCNITKAIERSTVDGSGTTANSVRALFSKALLNSDSGVRHSPLLWTMWLRFEQDVAGISKSIGEKVVVFEDARRRVRQVFYDGLRTLPWYKSWILMGTGCLSEFGNGNERELRQLYDVMTEREMRLRTDLDG